MSKKYIFCIILLFVIALSAVGAVNPIGAVSPDDVNSTIDLSLNEENNLNSNLNSNYKPNFNSINSTNSTNSINEDSALIGSLKSAKNLNTLKDNLSIGGGPNSNVKSSNLSSSKFFDDNTESELIIIDDSNFDTYFNTQGFISSDIESNSSICFGNLSNRYIKLDIPLKISSLTDTTVFNSTIEILEDASGSRLSNLNLYANATNENSDYLSPIYINQASDLIIENNFIYIDFYDGSNYNLAGIYAFGASNNNQIRNNRISIYSKSEESKDKHYIYGIDFSAFSSSTFSTDNAHGNVISSNTIDIISDYYANSITLSCAADTVIDSNYLYLQAKMFVYGIVAEYFDSGYGMEASNNFSFLKNTIEATSSMVYAIEFFNVFDVNISENSIKTNSNGTYAISGYESHDFNIENNSLIIIGNDISSVGANFDAIGTGHSGIYFMKNSYNIRITENKILSNYSLGGDYAIKFDSTSNQNISVYNNNLSSNNANYLADEAVSGNVNIYDNYPYIVADTAYTIVNSTVFDIYVDLSGNDNSGNGSIEKPFISINKALNYLKELNDDLSSENKMVNGVIHLGEGKYEGYGTNLRLYITGLAVDIVGVYNKTIIDGKASHWFFEISEGTTVSIKNIIFTNGTYRKNNIGLIYNKGNLNIENSSFINSKVPASSAVILNDGNLNLKNSFMELDSNSYLIYNNGLLKLSNNTLISSNKSKTVYNNGFIDNLYLTLVKNSPDENERISNFNSTRINLTAFVYDDNGNPISGGSVKFFIEGREISVNAVLNEGTAFLKTYSSLHGTVKISGFYTNSYTNLNVNIGRINNALVCDSIVIYVKLPQNDTTDSPNNDNNPNSGFNEDALGEDGSLEHPFSSINKAFGEIAGNIEPITVRLLDFEFSEDINSSLISGSNLITILGCENKTNIHSFWFINTTTPITLKDLIFDGFTIVKNNSDLTVDNCLFANSPLSAIYSLHGSLTVLNSNFTSNNVKDYHQYRYSTLSAMDKYIIKLVFPMVNETPYHYRPDMGGAIFAYYSNLTVLNSSFLNNEAMHGGAIFNSYSNLHISNSNFFNNLAFSSFSEDSYSQSKGGSIVQLMGDEIVITDSYFHSNAADGIAGAFYSSGIYPNINVTGSILACIGKIITSNETAYYTDEGNPVTDIYSPQDIYFINCTFDSNMAPGGGGAIYIINNSLSSYISCNFINNMVYTYNTSELFGGYTGNKNIRESFVYQDQLDNVYSLFFDSANYGGAIHDNNLKIIDSTFTANTFESGGSLILPSIVTYTTERSNLDRSKVGVSVVNSVTGSESVYVADSSLLTAGDSAYLGINGWSGSSNGSSIRRIIDDGSNSHSGNANGNGSGSGNSNNDGSGSGNGNGGGSGSGNGNGGGTGSGTLNWGDILSALGGDSYNIAINGDGSGLAEYLNNLIHGQSNSNSSSSSNGSDSSLDNATNSSSNGSSSEFDDSTNSSLNGSSSDFENVDNITNASSTTDSNMNNTSNSTVENEGSNTNSTESSENTADSNIESDGIIDINDDEVDSDVGESADPLSGEPSESSQSDSESDESSSSAESSSSSPGTSSSGPVSSSAKAYNIQKDVTEESVVEKEVDIKNLVIILILFLSLIILGYYKKSRNGDEK